MEGEDWSGGMLRIRMILGLIVLRAWYWFILVWWYVEEKICKVASTFFNWSGQRNVDALWTLNSEVVPHLHNWIWRGMLDRLWKATYVSQAAWMKFYNYCTGPLLFKSSPHNTCLLSWLSLHNSPWRLRLIHRYLTV